VNASGETHSAGAIWVRWVDALFSLLQDLARAGVTSKRESSTPRARRALAVIKLNREQMMSVGALGWSFLALLQ
jgi:hypothetical protein